MIDDIIPIEMLDMKLKNCFSKNGLAYFNLFNTDKIEELPLIQFGGTPVPRRSQCYMLMQGKQESIKAVNDNWNPRVIKNYKNFGMINWVCALSYFFSVCFFSFMYFFFHVCFFLCCDFFLDTHCFFFLFKANTSKNKKITMKK